MTPRNRNSYFKNTNNLSQIKFSNSIDKMNLNIKLVDMDVDYFLNIYPFRYLFELKLNQTKNNDIKVIPYCVLATNPFEDLLKPINLLYYYNITYSDTNIVSDNDTISQNHEQKGCSIVDTGVLIDVLEPIKEVPKHTSKNKKHKKVSTDSKKDISKGKNIDTIEAKHSSNNTKEDLKEKSIVSSAPISPKKNNSQQVNNKLEQVEKPIDKEKSIETKKEKHKHNKNKDKGQSTNVPINKTIKEKNNEIVEKKENTPNIKDIKPKGNIDKADTIKVPVVKEKIPQKANTTNDISLDLQPKQPKIEPSKKVSYVSQKDFSSFKVEHPIKEIPQQKPSQETFVESKPKQDTIRYKPQSPKNVSNDDISTFEEHKRLVQQQKFKEIRKKKKRYKKTKQVLGYSIVLMVVLFGALIFAISNYKLNCMVESQKETIDNMQIQVQDLQSQVELLQTDTNTYATTQKDSDDKQDKEIEDIQSSIQDIDGDIDTINEILIGYSEEKKDENSDTLLERIEELEQENEDLQSTVASLSTKTSTLEKQISSLSSSDTSPKTTPPDDVKEETDSYDREMTSDGVLIKESGVSSSFFQKVEGYYNLIPQNVRNALLQDGWHIYLTNENFGSNFGYNYNILALTVYEYKAIYLSPQSPTSILHEVGHYIDYKCGWQNAAMDFYSDEVGNFCSIHSTHSNNYSTKVEYFAEAYLVYKINSSALLENCPQTYYFLQNCENNVS